MQNCLSNSHSHPSSFLQRFWQYQKERFPLLSHGALILAFAFSGVSLSAALRGCQPLSAPGSLAVAFVVAFCLFLQLRISDEHKDQIEDAIYRPYRPVPRGLITLRELSGIGILGAMIQFGAAFTLQPGLLVLLACIWIYLALMSREFFVGSWLRRHPIAYLLSHMMILPLTDCFITACDWLPAGSGPPHGLEWFILASFFNGIVIEVGRKIRSPETEEPGVETYSKLWGIRGATSLWLGAMVLTTGFAFITSTSSRGYALMELALLAVLIGGAICLSIRFCREPERIATPAFEKYSALWTLLLYLSLGGLPLLHLI